METKKKKLPRSVKIIDVEHSVFKSLHLRKMAAVKMQLIEGKKYLFRRDYRAKGVYQTRVICRKVFKNRNGETISLMKVLA